MDDVSGKSTRFRTKMKVGPTKLGRHTQYAQVKVPPTNRFRSSSCQSINRSFDHLEPIRYRSDDGERYYRHTKGARITKSSHFDYDYELGHKIKFICVAKGSPRPTITWFKDGAELYEHHYLHVSLERLERMLKIWNILSFLTVIFKFK